MKRFLDKHTYASAVGLGVGSVTKAINNGWVEVCEFPNISGDFIDIEKYPIKDYFGYIAICQKRKREKKPEIVPILNLNDNVQKE